MKPDPAALIALAERCERGEEGEQIEGDILLATAPDIGVKPWRRDRRKGWLRVFWDDSDPDDEHRVEAPNYTTSIDAQAALGVRIIGVRWIPIRRFYQASATAEEGIATHASAPTEPLARLAAILRALAARAVLALFETTTHTTNPKET